MHRARPASIHLAAVAFAAAGVGGCSCQAPPPALRASVAYDGFEPGCVVVTTSDPSGAAERTVTLQVPEGSRQGALLVAVYREEAWGPTLRVRAEARELDCSGPVVASDVMDVTAPEGQTQPVELSLSATDADGDRYVVSPPGRDCADGDPGRHPGAPEICNGLDQDCNLVADDGFDAGGACTDTSGCAGVIACQLDGTAACAASGTTLYPDEDGDGAGAMGAGVCASPGTGFVLNQDDCDDGDPFTALGADEICDRRDNDCDGRADLRADGGNPCPPTPVWAPYSVGGNNHDWQSVWSWADGGVWIASVKDDHFEQKQPSTTAFSDETCGSIVSRGIWADPRTGVAYAVGDGAKMLVNTASGCTARDSIAGTPSEPRAVWGFVTDAGALELYVAGDLGDTARWDGGGGVEALDAVPAVLRDLHGISPELLFAAGVGTGAPGQPQIYRFQPPSAWAAETLPPGVATSSDTVNGIHVVSSRLAYAVTDGGRVLRWDSEQWESVPGPDAGSLFRVLAFGKSSVFALARTALWEWDGGSWGSILDTGAAPVYDLHGTNPADIWVAGDNGVLRRWPK